jgi:hypothetical protein
MLIMRSFYYILVSIGHAADVFPVEALEAAVP